MMDTCPVCLKKRKNLESHMRIHSDEKPYSCNRCGLKFRYAHTLQKHLSHTKGSYKCPSCCAFFKKKRSLTVHRSNTHRKNTLSADTGTILTNRSEAETTATAEDDDTPESSDRSMQVHSMRPIKEEPNIKIEPDDMQMNIPYFLKYERKSEICSEVAPSTSYAHDADSGYINKTSDESLPENDSSPPHEMIVNPYLSDEIIIYDNPEQEKIEESSNDSDYIVTEQYAEKDENAVCNPCLPSDKLLDNYATQDPTDNDSHICDICERKFESGAFLIAHKNHAKTLLPFQCDYCCNSYPSNFNLLSHMKFVHSHITQATPGTTNAHGSGTTTATTVVTNSRFISSNPGHRTVPSFTVPVAKTSSSKGTNINTPLDTKGVTESCSTSSETSTKTSTQKDPVKKKFKTEEVECEVCHKKMVKTMELSVCQPCLTLFRQFRHFVDATKNLEK